MNRLALLIWRDIGALAQGGRAFGLSCLFALLAVTLFPFAVGPDRPLLAAIAPGVIWVLALFLSVLHGQRVFVEDESDGALEQLLALGFSPGLVVFSRIVAHWVVAFAPLLFMVPILDVLLGAGLLPVPQHILSLLVGTPALSALAALGAALTIGAQQATLVLVAIVFPLMIPPLIFGTAAAAGGTSGAFMFAGAVSLFSLVICPIAGHYALRAAMR
ncbi:MAG: heme exporter protein CcmB [Pseudomonadota bacterium]